MSNEMIELITSHRSTRKYTDQPIADEILTALFDAAQWAPSSHLVQAYSIIVVKNQEMKQKLSELCAQAGGSQKYVATCPVFFVFCADYHRLKMTCDMHETAFEIDEVENLIVGAVDTALAAENVLLAARSFGLGGVMIGGIRNNPDDIVELLKLPRYTIPMMGLCLGYPAEDPGQKPRLPQRVVVHEEVYNEKFLAEGLEEYESITSDYYSKRTNGRVTTGWTHQMAQYLSHPRRAYLKDFIVRQGIGLK